MQKTGKPYLPLNSERKQQLRAPMNTPNCSLDPLEVPHYANDLSIDAILERYNFAYVLAQVKRMVHFHRKIAHPGVLDLELEDIAQEVHIRFWQKLQEEPIQNPEAYIARMIRNKCIDGIRRHSRPGCPESLPMTDNGDILEGGVMVVPGEGMADPADEYEQKLAMADHTNQVVEAVSSLPQRQQLAMACSLLDRVDNLIQFVEALNAHEMNIEMHWPEDKADEHLLKASLSAARQSLAKRLNIDLSLYKRTKRSSSVPSSASVRT